MNNHAAKINGRACIIKNICKIFDIKPHFTSKGEILFDSGVLNEFFSKVVEKNER